MMNRKAAGLLAAGAVVALMAAPAAQAQIYGPGPMPPPRVDVYSDNPKAEPGDMNWSARQNVVDSDRYEALVHTNPAFRAARIRKECGSINEPDLYQQCVSTFR
jgi:hypothetical protein